MTRTCLSFFIVIALLSTGCQKEDSPKQLLLQDLVGTWELLIITGGFTGAGRSNDFTVLEIMDKGKYEIFRADSLLSEGRIKLDLKEGDEFDELTFKPKKRKNMISFEDSVKRIQWTSDVQLNLNDPCCDRFTYTFVR